MPIVAGPFTVDLNWIATGSTLVLGLNPDALERALARPAGQFVAGLSVPEAREIMTAPAVFALHAYALDAFGAVLRGIPFPALGGATKFASQLQATLLGILVTAIDLLDHVYDVSVAVVIGEERASVRMHVGSL